MTIAAVWVRTLDNGVEELVFCSDSRLSSGKRFDHCQKTFCFSRTDAAICFAGRTDWAYPMIIAAIKAANIHFPSQVRALGLSKFKSHLVDILNQMQREVHSYARGENIPEVTFIIGGYDWFEKAFRIWRIKFEALENKFIAHERKGSSRFGSLGKIEIAGDPEWITEVRVRLKGLAQKRYGQNMRQPESAKFNMEPFEIIRDLLRESTANDSIGGAPQAVKVYQYLNSTDVGFFWPSADSGRLFISGRPLLEYERASINSVIDPDTLNSTWSSGNTAVASGQIEKANMKEQVRASATVPVSTHLSEMP
ncbi:hypothetical protein IR016_22980 [Pseudomonas putida]|uniref:hypothetical protein n=1 Tax=Pseudomonas putida TaxID=303 RepID=UPI0018AA5BDE|nr:hypothetical protein [Pseudomonas putida]MBF8709654.1 hypothetical protein [Pseudomonas putida]